MVYHLRGPSVLVPVPIDVGVAFSDLVTGVPRVVLFWHLRAFDHERGVMDFAELRTANGYL